jgi:hypothetical protein
MGARAITDLDNVKSWAPSTQGVDDAVLERSLDAASILLEQMCNRRFRSAEYSARHSGSKAYGVYCDRIILCDPETLLTTPVVTAITLVTEDGSALASAVSSTNTIADGEYAIYDAHTPVLRRASVSGNIPYPTSWAPSYGNVLISYTAGYDDDTMPPDIVQACIELTWTIYREGARAGMTARQASTGSASFMRELSPTAQAAVEHHTIYPATRTLSL